MIQKKSTKFPPPTQQKKINFKQAKHFFSLGKVFAKKSEWKEAIAAYCKAVELAPEWKEARQSLADAENQLQEKTIDTQQQIEPSKKSTRAEVPLEKVAIQEEQKSAIATVSNTVIVNSNLADNYHTNGNDLVEKGEKEEAIKAYKKAVVINPELWEVHHKLGNLLQEKGELEAATTAYNKSIELKSDFCWSYHNLGNVLVKLEKWDEAIASYQKAIELEPNFPWSYYNLAELYLFLEKWDEAVNAYRQFMQIQPDFSPKVEEKLNQALHQQVKGRLEQALSYYRQAIENDPTDVESYEKALEIKPDDPELYFGLGNAWIAKGEKEKASMALKKAITLSPELHEAHIKLAKLNTQEIEIELGIKTEITQNNSNQYISNLGTSGTSDLEMQENSNNLSPVFPKLDNFDLEDISTSEWYNYYEQGNQLQLEGQIEKANIAYYQAILINPHHSWSYHNLGDTHLKLGHWQEAITAYKKAIRLNPDYFWSNYNLGVAYSNSEKWNLAVQLYVRSIKLNPGLNLPCFALKETLNKQWNYTIKNADILLKQGERKSANNIYKQSTQQYQDCLPIEYLNISKEIPNKPSILLVVDDFLPQCLRYRVHQKIEHLEAAGFSVKFIPQKEIQEAKNIIHFFHVVIFYRVPAFPEIIETIKYAKAIRKVVFYEIDDLIFDPEEYPDSFDSYAGQITHDEYEGLCRGTILFQEAMALCDYGIASTPALAQEMKKVISTKTIFIHRNALDSHNFEFLKVGLPKIKRDYISIFYGTGTKAHNSDFNELAAPAIAQILENYPQVRLTVVGYLTLPEVLLSYQNRIDRVEVIRDIKIYWDFLKQADINIAVLHPTKVNNCKSELKWFEAAILGVPSVVSATQTYLEVVEHGVDGLIAKTTEEWYENLERLVTDEQLRSSLAQAAYEKTFQNYSIPVMAKNIQQIIMTGIEQEIEKGNLVRRSAKQKLLIVNVFYPPQSIGGGTRIVRDNVDMLMEKYSDKYDIQVFTSDNDHPVPYQITEYIYKNVHVTKVSTPMQEGMDWQYKNPEMYEIFTQYLKFNQPDLIHFHCVQRLTASVLEAAANLNIPYLVTIHDAWWISDSQFLVNEAGLECDYQQNDPLVVTRDAKDITESIRRRHYLRQRLNEASVVLAVSETFAELYRRNGFPQTCSNRNGIMPRPKLPRQPSSTGRVRLAHVGGMAAHKGYFLLKQAVESTLLSNLELIVVNHAQAAGTISEDYWGTTPVKFINKIPQEKMPEFYSTIDILAAPSIWPESYGLVAREALAAGVWVIVSNKGALAEDLIPGVHGDVFNPDYPEELVEILKKIDMNPEFYQQMLKDDFPVRTTEDQVRELQEIYLSVGNFDNLSTSDIRFNQITPILNTDKFEIMQQTVQPSKIVQNNNPLKVLLCGFEHSGTTLVSEILRQHPQLDSGFEGGFLLNDSIHQFLSTEPFYTNVKEGWGVNDDDLKYICDAEDWPDVYQRLRERAKFIKNKDVLLFDKTPQYMQALPSVLERVPNVSCLVIVRDFRAIFWSSFKRTGLTIDEWYEKIFPITVDHVLSYCDGWQKALQQGLVDRILLVKYEDLCLNRHQESSKIFDFLGLEFMKSYLSFAEARYPHVYGNNISNKYLLEYRDNLPEHISNKIKESMSKYSDWFWGDS